MTTLYDKDFYLWIQTTTEQLKRRKFDAVDWDNLIEELETLGRSERDKLISSLKVLIAHLLKWQFQPEKRTKSWENTIFRERENIAEYLEDTPSIQQFLSAEWMAKAYNRGRRIVIKETELDEELFPKDCTYSLEQILDFEFLPNQNAK